MIKLDTRWLGLALGTASLSLLLAGCGGTSYNGNTTGQTTPSADPAIIGVDPGLQENYGFAPEVSAPALPPGGATGPIFSQAAYMTGAFSTNATVLPGFGTTLPYGFPGGGYFVNALTGSNGAPYTGVAAPTSGTMVFRADIANGETSSGTVIPINPTSCVLTNIPSTSPAFLPSDAGIVFTKPMCFSFPVTAAAGGPPTGPLGNAEYVTGTPTASGANAGYGVPAAFPTPYTTTGIHGFRVTVSDTGGHTVHTDFHSIYAAPNILAIFAQDITPDTPKGSSAASINPGDKCTIDGGVGIGVNPQSTADSQGTVVFFVTVPTGGTASKPATATHVLVDTTQKLTQTLTVTSAEGGTIAIQ